MSLVSAPCAPLLSPSSRAERAARCVAGRATDIVRSFRRRAGTEAEGGAADRSAGGAEEFDPGTSSHSEVGSLFFVALGGGGDGCVEAEITSLPPPPGANESVRFTRAWERGERLPWGVADAVLEGVWGARAFNGKALPPLPSTQVTEAARGATLPLPAGNVDGVGVEVAAVPVRPAL